MSALKWLLLAASLAMFGTVSGVAAYDVYVAMQFQKLMSRARVLKRFDGVRVSNGSGV